MKNCNEILKNYADSLRTRKFVKCLGKCKKNLKILRETFKKILRKCKVNFEQIRWSEKGDKIREVYTGKFLWNL